MRLVIRLLLFSVAALQVQNAFAAAPEQAGVEERLQAIQAQLAAFRRDYEQRRPDSIQGGDASQQRSPKFTPFFDLSVAPPPQKRLVAWQPMKRAQAAAAGAAEDTNTYGAPAKQLVAWQPMKRSGSSNIFPADDREQLVRAVESRLLEVLAAGERLGVAPADVLDDIRQRNAAGNIIY